MYKWVGSEFSTLLARLHGHVDHAHNMWHMRSNVLTSPLAIPVETGLSNKY